MMKKIYKYPLSGYSTQEISMPVGAQILTAQMQGETLCLWALVDPDVSETENVVIEIFATGQPIHYDMGISRNYISTFQMLGGQLVFHVFQNTGI